MPCGLLSEALFQTISGNIQIRTSVDRRCRSLRCRSVGKPHSESCDPDVSQFARHRSLLWEGVRVPSERLTECPLLCTAEVYEHIGYFTLLGFSGNSGSQLAPDSERN